MSEHPAISVIVPTYDTRAMTLDCCRAALEALGGRGELIVSDDGSRDGTSSAIATALPDAIVTRSEINRGYSAAANAGATLARAPLLFFLNSDAIVTRATIDAILRLFDDATIGIASPQLTTRAGDPSWTGGREPTLLWLAVLASGVARFLPRRSPIVIGVVDVDWVSGAAMVVRRDVWQECGPFATRYRFYGQDLELCSIARRKGIRVVIDHSSSVVHLHGATIAAGSAADHDPELLWSDLLTWARTMKARAWALAARILMIGGGSKRVAVRMMVGAFRTPQFRATTKLYARAVRGLLREPVTSRR